MSTAALSNYKTWNNEAHLLRNIILETGLQEETKWKQLCYTWNGKNIVIIGELKSCCVLGFFKGVLLKDNEKLLISPGENSQHVKQFQFTSLQEIEKNKNTIKAYIFEAIEVEKLGLKIETKAITEYQHPEELTQKFNEIPKLRTAFEALTPGRQKGYLLHFSEAKQSTTRTARIEKYIDKILAGKGMRDCTCGLSRRMPNCDGSHKKI